MRRRSISGSVGWLVPGLADRMADRLLAGMFIAAFVRLSLPMVGVGITLSRHVSPKDPILGFAIAVSAGIAASTLKLAGRTTPARGVKPHHHLVENPNERRAQRRPRGGRVR
jgi:hypothetical protein